MPRAKYLLLGSVLLGSLALALASCGGKGGGGGDQGPPFIGAELDSFPPGSAPPGFTSNAIVEVLDSNGNSIPNASVTMNAIPLAYNPDSGDYEGSVLVAPGNGVTVSVTVGSATYTASATQFTSYPTVAVPAANDTWDSSAQNTVTWSGGAPIAANAEYVLGILDAGDPNGALQWPASRFLQEVPLGTTSFPIPAVSIPAGDRLMIVGISADTAIPGALPGSVLVVTGLNYAPIAVTGFPVTVRNTNTIAASLASVAWSGTQFVAVGAIPGSSFATNVGAILTSPDGITWTPRNSGTSAFLIGVVSSGTAFVAVGGNSTVGGPATILTSADGVSWTPRAAPGTLGGGALTGVTWSGTQFVAVGSIPGSIDTILTSPDGITWTPHPPGTSKGLSAVTWSGTQFVAVGGSGQILTSPDGVTWTSRNSGATNGLRSVAWSGTQFAAAGGFEITTSPDGVTWTPRSSATTAQLFAVASSGTEFVGAGYGGPLTTSSDGVTWTPRAPGAGAVLSGIVWTGSKFLIVGTSATEIAGAVLTSP
jgi:hypothetical protein